jgi:outer membrane lipoprotein SlyB
MVFNMEKSQERITRKETIPEHSIVNTLIIPMGVGVVGGIVGYCVGGSDGSILGTTAGLILGSGYQRFYTSPQENPYRD